MANKLLNDPREKGPYEEGPLDSHGFGEPDIGPGHDTTASGDSSDPTGGSWTKPSRPRPTEDAHGYPSSSPQQLKDAENSKGSGGQGSDDSLSNREGIGSKNGLYNQSGDKSPRGVFNQARGGYQNLKKRISKHKWLYGIAFGAGGGFVILIVALLLLVGAYKVVDFAEHVAAYQFARTTSQMAEDSTNITTEAIDLDSIPDDSTGNAFLASIKNKYSSATGQVGEVWSNLDKYRPDKVISNFDNSGTLKFNTSRTRLGRIRYDSVTIADEESGIYNTYELNNSFAANHIPGFKFNSDFQYSRDFAPDLITTLEANSIGPITRARIAAEIRERLGIGLVAWDTARYAGKSEETADGLIEQKSLSVAEGSEDPTNSDVPSNVNDTAKQAQTDVNSAVNDPSQLSQIVQSGGAGLPQTAVNDINQAFTVAVFSSISSLLNKVASLINPVFKYATPLCLIFDGSLVNSGSTMDNQSNQLERSAVWVQSAAAQEKDGSNVTGEAVGATDWKLGDITKSYAEQRASGLQPDTSSYPSTEASPTGEYSIADYGLGSSLGGVVNSMAPHICPLVTNPYGAVGVGVVSIFATSGTEVFSGDVAGASVSTLIGQVMKRVVANTGDALNDVFSFKTVGTLGAIGGATLLAKHLVVSQISANHSSLATGQSYDNDVDDGTNIYANEINQKEFYGAPMTDADLSSDNAANQQMLAQQESKQSAYERYAAIDNPDSLVSRLGIMADDSFNGSFFSSLANLGADILNPLRSFSSALKPLMPKTWAATATPVTSVNTYYGNVQFGYSQAEKALLDSCPQDTHRPDLCSYQLLENQQILDNSNNEAAIASRYGDCFTDSVAQLEASGELQRSQDGDVIAKASDAPDPSEDICAPDNLSFDSPDPLAEDSDPTSPNAHDMIFRYRVAEGYDNTLDQLTDEQTITTTDSTPSSVGSAPTPTGPVSSSGYEDPFRDVKNLGTSRVDEGVDFTGSGPVYALGNGTVLNTTNTGWPGGTFIVYQLRDGPAQGKYVYMAENCNNIQVHIGETVSPSTVLCDMVNADPHIETGWADGSALGDALAKSVYIELPSGVSYSTAYGQNFRELLTSLGNKVSSCYDFPGAKLSGSLQSGWPTWASNPATNSGSPSC
jgi:hypothetical protein